MNKTELQTIAAVGKFLHSLQRAWWFGPFSSDALRTAQAAENDLRQIYGKNNTQWSGSLKDLSELEKN